MTWIKCKYRLPKVGDVILIQHPRSKKCIGKITVNEDDVFKMAMFCENTGWKPCTERK